MIKFVDMFSGIGGFREGLTRAEGFECVGHCEIDKYANRSYNALFDTKGEWFIEDARKADPSTIYTCLPILRTALGHDRITTTEKYLRLVPEAYMEVTEPFNDRFHTITEVLCNEE